MYLKHNIVARSRNHYKGDEARYPLCIVLLHVTVAHDNIACCTKMILWLLYVAWQQQNALRLRVKCPKFLSDFNQIWTISTDFFYKSL
jgi:hypothetical protein